MPELPEPCGAMSVDDGPYTGKGSDLPHMQGARLERSVDGYSAAQMHAYALTYASQTLASRDGEIARLRDAAGFLLGCFEPDRDAYVFSKRLALTKLRAAIQQTKDTK